MTYHREKKGVRVHSRSRRFVRSILIVCFSTLSTVATSAQELDLVSWGSSWKYDTSQRNLRQRWRRPTFDDSAWAEGVAPLGYGDPDIVTDIGRDEEPTSRPVTRYFHHSFAVADPDSIESLTLRFVRDDGCVIYLNGIEIVRSNMPAGPIRFTTLAVAPMGARAEREVHTRSIAPDLLVAGNNLLAVEVHQSSFVNPDARLDAELTGALRQIPPTVNLLTPELNTTTRDPQVSFSGIATGSRPLHEATITVLDDAGALAYQETRPLSGTTASFSFDGLFEDGRTYTWNCLVLDDGGLASQSAVDGTFGIDTELPDSPLVVSPTEDSQLPTNSALLEAEIRGPAGATYDVTFLGRPDPLATEDFTVVVLPDTQIYSQSFPQIFEAQTRWIADNVGTENIVFVSHLGDIVQHPSSVVEWMRADQAMSILDGVVPYGLLPGNNDQPSVLYNETFPWFRFIGEPWYGGSYREKNDCSYQLFSGGPGLDFIIVHLEFCPSLDVLTWATEVLQDHPDRIGIVSTHGFIQPDGRRLADACGSTEYIWDGLIANSPNVRIVLNGHTPGEGRRSDSVNGRIVHQMVSDYQADALGGAGWLRLLRFKPSENRLSVETYSPWRNEFRTGPQSTFSLPLPMTTFRPIGSRTGLTSGSIAATTWTRLDPGAAYEWSVEVTSINGSTIQSPTRRFWAGDRPAPIILARDDFESGDFGGGTGWKDDAPFSRSRSVIRNVNQPHSGSYHARVLPTGWLARTVDLTGAAEIQLTYWSRQRNWEEGDQALVSVRQEGQPSRPVQALTADGDEAYRKITIDLTPYAPAGSLEIIFEARLDHADDAWFIDDLEVVIVPE